VSAAEEDLESASVLTQNFRLCSTMAGRHNSRSSGIMSMRSQRSTAAVAASELKKIAATTYTGTLQALKFYWNRPLGASTGTFRLTVCLAHNARQQQNKQAPLSWSLAYTTVDDLCAAILESVSVVAIELVGSAEAYEALGGVTQQQHAPTVRESSWNKIRDALVTVLHRCRDDNSSSNSASNLMQSLQFASGVMDQQTASLLASTLKKRGPSKFDRREVQPPKYSVRIHYDIDIDKNTTQNVLSSSSSSLLTDTLQQLWVGRDQLHELHIHFEGDGGGGSGSYPYPYAVTVQDATLLAEILPHLHIVSFHRVVFACPAAWKLVFASLEESSFLEHLHLDVSVLNRNNHNNLNSISNNSKSKWKSYKESSVTTTAVTTTTTTPDQMATLQAYLDWHVRLNTVRRCLVERDCGAQLVQSKSMRSRRFIAYQQQQQQLSVSDDGGPHAAMAAMTSVEALAPATETAAVMDAAVVVLKDWWRATHRPDLPQYQYSIPERESGGVYPPHHHHHHYQGHDPTATATGLDKNGAAENQRSAGVGPTSLEQRAASNDAN
jgi:hypothetical protein